MFLLTQNARRSSFVEQERGRNDKRLVPGKKKHESRRPLTRACSAPLNWVFMNDLFADVIYAAVLILLWPGPLCFEKDSRTKVSLFPSVKQYGPGQGKSSQTA